MVQWISFQFLADILWHWFMTLCSAFWLRTFSSTFQNATVSAFRKQWVLIFWCLISWRMLFCFILILRTENQNWRTVNGSLFCCFKKIGSRVTAFYCDSISVLLFVTWKRMKHDSNSYCSLLLNKMSFIALPRSSTTSCIIHKCNVLLFKAKPQIKLFLLQAIVWCLSVSHNSPLNNNPILKPATVRRRKP